MTPNTQDTEQADGTAVVVAQSASLATYEFTDEDVQLIKDTVCKDANDSEFRLFLAQCRHTGLNPLAKQIYAVFRWSGKEQRKVMSIQTGIDGFRLIAQRTGLYDGQTPTEWCDPEGNWFDVWLREDPPYAARAGVWKKGVARPTVAVARWSEYVQKDAKKQVVPMWKNMPSNQLAKCAEALALRKAFPADLSGIYTDDEMSQADNNQVDGEAIKAIVQPPGMSAAPVQQTELLLTPEQRRELWDKWCLVAPETDGVIDENDLREIVQRVAGVDHTERIPQSKLLALYREIEAYGQVSDAEVLPPEDEPVEAEVVA